jgi:hypothetical protein
MADLELGLRSLAGRDDLFPTTPDIASGFAGQISVEQPARRRDLRLVAILALIVLAAIATALAVPASRTAIADFFGIEGIRIEFHGDAPEVPATPTSIGGSLLLGEEVTMAEASDAAPFAVVAPADDATGEPDEVYLNRRSGATVVGLLWQATDALPEIGDTGVGMLLLEIEADADDELFVKKIVGGGDFATTTIDGSMGFWIQNGVLAVEPVEGLLHDLLGPEARRSGNVLIWSDGEVTYRLETSLPMADAVRIAESLSPVGAGGNP